MQENNNLIRGVLSNLESIKSLEAENKKLQEMILKSQNSELLKNKIQDLLFLIEEKDKNFKKLEEKIKKEHSLVLIQLTKKLQEEKTVINRLLEKLPLIETLKNENKILKENLAKMHFLMKKEYEKKLSELNGNYHIYKEKHKSVLKEYEKDKLSIKNSLEQEKQKKNELIEKNKKLFEIYKEQEIRNLKLKEIYKKTSIELNNLKSLKIKHSNFIEDKEKNIKETAKKKVNELAKEFLEKEIEYRAIIDSQKQDLIKYSQELRIFKEKYFRREKELKEKFKELF